MSDLETDDTEFMDFSSSLHSLAEQVPPERLARAGFYFIGSGDKVQCFSCKKTLDNWSKGDLPVERHRAISPGCTFIRCVYPVSSPPLNGENNEEKKALEYRLGTGQVVDQTTYPKVHHMRSEEARLQTFTRWPPNCPVSPPDLAQAGFFYVVSNDYVQCFCCGGLVGDWEPGDTAWGEHERHYPNCWFILGHDVGNMPLQGGYQEENRVRNHVFMGTFEERLKSFQGIQHVYSPERLAQAGLYSTDEDPLEKLEKLQQEKRCKICMDRDISMVFIPCGHLVACQQCARALNKCPICCGAIKQKVKTYLA